MKHLILSLVLATSSIAAMAQVKLHDSDGMQPSGCKNLRYRPSAQQLHDGKSNGCR